MIKKCYPQGKEKAFSVSYDAGVLQDIRLVELMNRYGIRGTFNLNSALMESGFAWIHENGMMVKRPIVVGEDFVLVGFREAQWESALL
jgi:hypothetical protein